MNNRGLSDCKIKKNYGYNAFLLAKKMAILIICSNFATQLSD